MKDDGCVATRAVSESGGTAQKSLKPGLDTQWLPAQLFCHGSHGHRFEPDLHFAQEAGFNHVRLVLQHTINRRDTCGAEPQRGHFHQLRRQRQMIDAGG